jgi:hypothetical protein
MHSEKETGLELPGPWIEHPDRDWAFLARTLLDAILDQLKEAQMVLTLFQGASAHDNPSVDCRLRFLYARSFIYALDAAGQLIQVLKGNEHLPATALSHCEQFLSQFGVLRDLRNSLQHIEDRVRGLCLSRGKKMPIPNPLLVLGAFRDNSFGATTAKGRYVEIEISNSVLVRAFAIVEDLIWCFDWLAPGNIRLYHPKVGA